MRFHRQNRKGIEALEFALMLPVYVSVVMGILEFGRAFEVAQWLTAAAREGARLAMLYNVTNANDVAAGITSPDMKIKTDIENFLKAAGINTGVTVSMTEADQTVPPPPDPPFNAAFSINDPTAVSGKYFRVRVSVPFKDVCVAPPAYLGSANLIGEIVVRHE